MLYTPEELTYWPAYVTPRVRRRLCRLASHTLRTLTDQKQWKATSHVRATDIGNKLRITCKSATQRMVLDLNWGDLRLARLLRDDPLELGENDALVLIVHAHVLRGIYLTTPHGKRGQRVLAQLEALVRRRRGR